jgi:hypothetical protein
MKPAIIDDDIVDDEDIEMESHAGEEQDSLLKEMVYTNYSLC